MEPGRESASVCMCSISSRPAVCSRPLSAGPSPDHSPPVVTGSASRQSSSVIPSSDPAAQRSFPITVRLARGNVRGNQSNSMGFVLPSLTSTAARGVGLDQVPAVPELVAIEVKGGAGPTLRHGVADLLFEPGALPILPGAPDEDQDFQGRPAGRGAGLPCRESAACHRRIRLS
jgi:hypothetical protein